MAGQCVQRLSLCKLQAAAHKPAGPTQQQHVSHPPEPSSIPVTTTASLVPPLSTMHLLPWSSIFPTSPMNICSSWWYWKLQYVTEYHLFFFLPKHLFIQLVFGFGSRFLEYHKYWTVVEIHLPYPTVDQNQGGLLVSQGNWGQVQSKFQAVTYLLTLDEAAPRLLGRTFVLVACGQYPARTFCLLAGQAARAATTWQLHAGGWPCFCGLPGCRVSPCYRWCQQQ